MLCQAIELWRMDVVVWTIAVLLKIFTYDLEFI